MKNSKHENSFLLRKSPHRNIGKYRIGLIRNGVFRGYCRLKLAVLVESKPSGAEVYLDHEFQGTTPCTVFLEAAPVITGQKQIIASPVDGSNRYVIRDSSYQGQTPYTLWVTKDGYEPLSHTLVMERIFPVEVLLHDKLYEKSVSVIFELEERNLPPPSAADAD